MNNTKDIPLSDRIMVFKVSKREGQSYHCLHHHDNMMEELENFVDYAEPGHSIFVEVVYMSRQEFHSLPELDIY